MQWILEFNSQETAQGVYESDRTMHAKPRTDFTCDSRVPGELQGRLGMAFSKFEMSMPKARVTC
jgi:hypothetical protein